MSITRLVSIGTFMGVIAVSAMGFDEWRTLNHCKAAWEHAGERTGDRLTDRAATPYLGMMLASKSDVPSDYRLARHDFVAACRAGAIWQTVTRDEAGVYQAPVPIAGRQAAADR
jgi:hypothetical protein